MPRAQLPLLPDGTTEINATLAFERRDDLVTYFYGHLPVFEHHVNDTQTFHLITSQFYVQGNATQAELCRAFGVTPISLKRAVKRYRKKGSAGFYETSARQGAAVLTPSILVQAQQLLDEGGESPKESKELAIKADTLRKAVVAGKHHKR